MYIDLQVSGIHYYYLFQFSDHPQKCLVLVQHVYKKTVENWQKQSSFVRRAGRNVLLQNLF